MSIIYDKEKQVFRLDTRNTTYQFRVAEFGFLEHLYYGRRIPDTAEFRSGPATDLKPIPMKLKRTGP